MVPTKFVLEPKNAWEKDGVQRYGSLNQLYGSSTLLSRSRWTFWVQEGEIIGGEIDVITAGMPDFWAHFGGSEPPHAGDVGSRNRDAIIQAMTCLKAQLKSQ